MQVFNEILLMVLRKFGLLMQSVGPNWLRLGTKVRGRRSGTTHIPATSGVQFDAWRRLTDHVGAPSARNGPGEDVPCSVVVTMQDRPTDASVDALAEGLRHQGAAARAVPARVPRVEPS
jgi:hypothetical protein